MFRVHFSLSPPLSLSPSLPLSPGGVPSHTLGYVQVVLRAGGGKGPATYSPPRPTGSNTLTLSHFIICKVAIHMML